MPCDRPRLYHRNRFVDEMHLSEAKKKENGPVPRDEMHVISLIHRLESDAPGKIDLVRKYYKDLILLLPGMREKIF